jgi:hypothetical protein
VYVVIIPCHLENNIVYILPLHVLMLLWFSGKLMVVYNMLLSCYDERLKDEMAMKRLDWLNIELIPTKFPCTMHSSWFHNWTHLIFGILDLISHMNSNVVNFIDRMLRDVLFWKIGWNFYT